MAETAAEELAECYAEARQRAGEGNLTGAFARYRRLIAAAESAQDTPQLAMLYREMGEMYIQALDRIEARRWLAEAMGAYRACGMPGEAAEAQHCLASAEFVDGDFPAALASANCALRHFIGSGDRAAELSARTLRSAILWAAGEQQAAAEELVRASVFAVRHGLSAAPNAALAAGWRSRVGTARLRRLICAATEDPDLRALLLS